MASTKPRQKLTYLQQLLQGMEALASRSKGPFTMSEIKAEISKITGVLEKDFGAQAESRLRTAANQLVDAGILQRAGTAESFFCVSPDARKRGHGDDTSMAETPAKRRKSAGVGHAPTPPTPAKQRQSLPSAPAATRKARQSRVSSPAPARRTRQSAASALGNRTARGTRGEIAPGATAAIAPPAARARNPTASDGDDDENRGDARATADKVNNQGQVEQLSDDRNDGDDRMQRGSVEDSNEQDVEPPLAGPSLVADYPERPSSSVLGRHGSNLTQISHDPPPAATDVPSPTSNHALLQSTKLLAVRDDLTAANAEIARMSQAAALAEEQARAEAVRLALFSAMEQQHIKSLDTQLVDARTLHATELRIAQSDNLTLRGQLNAANLLAATRLVENETLLKETVDLRARVERLNRSITLQVKVAKEKEEAQATKEKAMLQASDSERLRVTEQLQEAESRASWTQGQLDKEVSSLEHARRELNELQSNQAALQATVDTIKKELVDSVAESSEDRARLQHEVNVATGRVHALTNDITESKITVSSLNSALRHARSKATADLHKAQEEIKELNHANVVLAMRLKRADEEIEAREEVAAMATRNRDLVIGERDEAITSYNALKKDMKRLEGACRRKAGTAGSR